MEVLLILIFAPLALGLGFGLLRLMMNPVFWAVTLPVLALFSILLGAHH